MPLSRCGSGFTRLLTCTAASTSSEEDELDCERHHGGGGSAGGCDSRTRDSFWQRVFKSMSEHLRSSQKSDQGGKSGKKEKFSSGMRAAGGRSGGGRRRAVKSPPPPPPSSSSSRRSLRKRLIVALMEDAEAADVRTADEAADIRRLLRRLNEVIDECSNAEGDNGDGCGGVEVESSILPAPKSPPRAKAAAAEAAAAATVDAIACCDASCAATVVARPTTTEALAAVKAAATTPNQTITAAPNQSVGHRRCLHRYRGFRPHRCALPQAFVKTSCATTCGSCITGGDCSSSDWEDVAVYYVGASERDTIKAKPIL